MMMTKPDTEEEKKATRTTKNPADAVADLEKRIASLGSPPASFQQQQQQTMNSSSVPAFATKLASAPEAGATTSTAAGNKSALLVRLI
jgi:hypothetical protein